MRQVWALTLVAMLLATTGAARAEYLEGSQLEADAPVKLNDRVDALVNTGFASFVSPDGSKTVATSITADRLHVTWTSSYTCQLGDTTCGTAPNGKGYRTETSTLTDATVRIARALGAYQVVVTNDERHADTPSFGAAGPIVVTAGGATTLDATREAITLHPYANGWNGGQPQSLSEPVYAVAKDKAALLSGGGSLRAAGGFEVLFQGVEVEIKGKDAEGHDAIQTYRTTMPGGDETSFVVVEVGRGLLNANSKAPLAAYQVRAVDARGSATFTGASGTVRTEDGAKEHDREDVNLAGPLELTVASVRSGSPPRLVLAITSHLRVLEDTPIPDENEQPNVGELAAAGAAGAGGAALVAAALYYWPRWRFALTALMAPLYTRIQRSEVLEHGKRDEIYGLIKQTPGIHAHEIGERAAIGWGTTVYHLKLLEQHNLVVSKKSGRYKRFFVNTGEYTKTKDVYGALRNDTARAVAEFISKNPGCNQKELCAALGIQPSLASWHVQKLEGVGLVTRERDGRSVRYQTGPAWSDVAASNAAPAAGVDEGVAQS